MRIKDASLKLLLVVISMTVGLIILEVGYRLIKNIPLRGNLKETKQSDGTNRPETFQLSSNSILIYEPKPGAHSLYTGPDNFISQQGLRDRVYSLKKPADTFRIAFVGDSVVYGYGIVNEDTVSKQLEVLLNHNRRLKKKFEVINFGVPGYGTEQEVEWYLKKVKPFSPDLVIIGYCLNDSVISSWEYELFANKYFPLWSKFYSLEAVVDGVRIAVERRRFADSAPKNRAADPVFIGVKSIKDNIESVQPTLLLVIPALIPFDKYGNIDVHNRVREASAYFGVTHYDLLPIFSKYNYMDLRVPQFSFRDDTHLGRFGNKVAADAIMEWLMTKYKGKAAFL